MASFSLLGRRVLVVSELVVELLVGSISSNSEDDAVRALQLGMQPHPNAVKLLNARLFNS